MIAFTRTSQSHLNRTISIRAHSVISFHTTAGLRETIKRPILRAGQNSLSKVFLLKPTTSPRAHTADMSQDHTHLSDIGKMKTEADGSFKRKPSTFRNQIEKGGKFEPEEGLHMFTFTIFQG